MEKEKNQLFLLLKKSHKSSCYSEIRTHEQDVCALYKKLGNITKYINYEF